ncbi:MAG: L-2-hydroxyglutarate oxidase [Ignavibacterium album]|uniref:L-2-hydroxyglutarate oxidase n=1 Tax=Ignavibacterium album TaxID=591197 RepID=UPI0026E9641D|nr:L-2-hydroxyglutarate oxidase [Ignavibacterium album]MBI5662431.1 L-2-hydroxyglutarate oxidase [Ignavibacterium album]
MSNHYDIIFIGGGIVGTASALKLLQKRKVRLLLLEAEDSLAKHQTGNNSGVIHSGLYYKPGSLKALNCIRGREMLYEFCREQSIPHERCGKIVVATDKSELTQLKILEERGIENGLIGIKRLTKEEIKEYEPFADGIEALFVPQTGIVDYRTVTNKYARLIMKNGGEIKLNSKVLSIKVNCNQILVRTEEDEFNAKYLVNCGGLFSDKIARMSGINPDVKIIPFRGEYYELKKEKQYLVKNLIYPVPDPQFPFLGVHFTRTIHGGVEAGPNAVLAFKRTGYRKTDFDLSQVAEMFFYPGFWKMAKNHYQMGIEELRRSFSKKLFVKSLQKLIPELTENDIVPGGAGVRAQALDRNGKLLDDFRIVQTDKMIHVLNAPSPAATASLSIGDTISDMIIKNFKLN